MMGGGFQIYLTLHKFMYLTCIRWGDWGKKSSKSCLYSLWTIPLRYIPGLSFQYSIAWNFWWKRVFCHVKISPTGFILISQKNEKWVKIQRTTAAVKYYWFACQAKCKMSTNTFVHLLNFMRVFKAVFCLRSFPLI